LIYESEGRFCRIILWMSILVLSCAIGLAACGTIAATTPTVIVAKGADVGAAITSKRGLQVTLIGPPEKVEVISAAGTPWMDTGGLDGWGGGQGSDRCLPEGIWLIVPVKLSNTSSQADVLFPGKTFTVRDAQGRESPLEGRPEHTMKTFSDERWGDHDNYLVNNPMNAGVTREGPLIFDVATDATDLTLTTQGSDESLDLGF